MFKFSSFGSIETSVGTIPVKKLFCSSKFVKLSKLPISDGMAPSNRFITMRMLWSRTAFPISVGMVAMKKSNSKSNNSREANSKMLYGNGGEEEQGGNEVIR
jgi:hypothetical protein